MRFKSPLHPGPFGPSDLPPSWWLLNGKARVNFVTKEPSNWPLTRPATFHEWQHVIKLLVLRRVPKLLPIHRLRLTAYVVGDLEESSKAGLLYAEPGFAYIPTVGDVINKMCARDNTLRLADHMEDPEMPFPAEAVYRAERVDEWLSRVPVVVKAISSIMSTTSVLDLIVKELLDQELMSEPQADDPGL